MFHLKNKRWKNYALWLSILAFIPLVISALTDYGVTLVLPSNYAELVKALLAILVLGGLISSPNEGDWFGDDPEETEK